MILGEKGESEFRKNLRKEFQKKRGTGAAGPTRLPFGPASSPACLPLPSLSRARCPPCPIPRRPRGGRTPALGAPRPTTPSPWSGRRPAPPRPLPPFCRPRLLPPSSIRAHSRSSSSSARAIAGESPAVRRGRTRAPTSTSRTPAHSPSPQ